MFWVNVDKPDNKTCTIHSEGCGHILKSETPYKGIGELKRDGGWFCFASLEEAENYYQREWRPKGYIIRRGGCCFT